MSEIEQNSIIITPEACFAAMQIMNPYLKGALSTRINMRLLSKNSANEVYLAFQQVFRLTELMKITQMPIGELIELLECVDKDQREQGSRGISEKQLLTAATAA